MGRYWAAESIRCNISPLQRPSPLFALPANRLPLQLGSFRTGIEAGGGILGSG